MRTYLVALPPGHYREPERYPAIDWRMTARRIHALDAPEAAGLFVESYGGQRAGLHEVAPWGNARVFAYVAHGKETGRVFVALGDGPGPQAV